MFWSIVYNPVTRTLCEHSYFGPILETTNVLYAFINTDEHMWYQGDLTEFGTFLIQMRQGKYIQSKK